MANGSLAQLFWRALDALDYWVTQARLWAADAVSDPKQEIKAGRLRQCEPGEPLSLGRGRNLRLTLMG